VEKFIFFATLKEGLKDLGLPQESIDENIKLFEEGFKGRSSDEIDKIIEEVGGIDSIVRSIYNHEKNSNKKNEQESTEQAASAAQSEDETSTKNSDNITEKEDFAETEETNEFSKATELDISISEINTDTNIEIPIDAQTEDELAKTDIFIPATVTPTDNDNNPPEETTELFDISAEQNTATSNISTGLSIHQVMTEINSTKQSEQLDSTKELEITDDIKINTTQKIDSISREFERTTVTPQPIKHFVNAEYADDFTEYDFEGLFAEKLTPIESIFKKIRTSMNDTAFWVSLPFALILTAIFFVIPTLLFPCIIASAIIVGAIYLVSLVIGLVFAVIPIGYSIYMMFFSLPVAMYELGIGLTVLGITMFACILLYNYVKRLVPFLLKMAKKLFAYCVKCIKRYYRKPTDTTDIKEVK